MPARSSAEAGSDAGRDRYLALFEKAAAGAGGPGWLRSLRREAIERFAATGFPTTREEAWRKTPVGPIARADLRPAAGDGAADAPTTAVIAGESLDEGAIRIVFVDGAWSPALSRLDGIPGGVQAGSIARALRSDGAALEERIGRLARPEDSPFTALNTAFLEDGAFVLIPAGLALADPIHLIFAETTPGRGTVSHPRVLIVAGEGSQAAIVESHIGPASETAFSNAVTEIAAGPASVLSHTRLQRGGDGAFHVGTVQARLERGASFTSHSIALGGAIVRKDINALLGGPGADCTLNGLFLARREHLVDHHTLIDHATPHGTSRELYKGILGDRARGVFDGRIVVRPDAQKTDARQVNRNLILSDEALIDTKPQLEINADDVKCAHAATIGRLDDEALFYLRARGLDGETARAALIRAFASELTGRLRPAALRGRIEAAVAAMLPRSDRPETPA